MKNKKERLNLIAEILRFQVIGSQEELLQELQNKEIKVTQATLSRDLKRMKVAKTPLSNGTFKYVLPPQHKVIDSNLSSSNFTSGGAVLSIEFSGSLAVMKTKPGYANAVAWDIDNRANEEILGTIAGDDTILLIPREDVNRERVMEVIQLIFNNEK